MNILKPNRYEFLENIGNSKVRGYNKEYQRYQIGQTQHFTL